MHGSSLQPTDKEPRLDFYNDLSTERRILGRHETQACHEKSVTGNESNIVCNPHRIREQLRYLTVLCSYEVYLFFAIWIFPGNPN